MRHVLPLLLLLACGPDARPTAETPSEEGPRLEGWPVVPQVESTAVVRMLAIADALPPLPEADGVAWAQQVFVPWMEQRQRALAQASELRRSARRESTADQAVAVALHGAIFQRTHDSLRGAHAERIIRRAPRPPRDARGPRGRRRALLPARGSPPSSDGWWGPCPRASGRSRSTSRSRRARRRGSPSTAP